ncbi:hypothetical protein LZ30DRAFT_345676 [Colletotrichum cereale]|nr:hypothetical protein LZ30DRAFT_345676 [Colletotrichum cereale]
MIARLILSIAALLALAVHLGVGIVLQKADNLRSNGIFTVQFNNTEFALFGNYSVGLPANFSLGFQEACLGYKDLTQQCFNIHDVPQTVGSAVGGLELASLNEALSVIKIVNFDSMILSDLVFVSLVVILYIVVLWVRYVLQLWGRILLFIAMCIPLFVAVCLVVAIGMAKSHVGESGLEIHIGESALYSGISLGTAIVLNLLGAGLFI